VLGVSGVVLALVLLAVLEARRPAGPSLAALPCTGLVGDSTEPYVDDGLTQDLIDQLARSKRFAKVISFASSLRYRESRLSAHQIGDELGVDFLVFCRHERRAGTEVLSLQAVRTQDGAVAWSGDATVQESALAGTAFGVADGIARTLGLRGGPRLAGRETQRQPAPRALNLYREAQYFLGEYTEPAMRQNIALFREAIDADSAFAEPYVGLGTAYLLLALGHSDADQRELLPLVHEAAERSLSLNPDLADAHALLASYMGEAGIGTGPSGSSAARWPSIPARHLPRTRWRSRCWPAADPMRPSSRPIAQSSSIRSIP
jgi:adenylate cyclase